MEILPNINSHEDMLALTREEQVQLCQEIRDFLTDHVSKTGGHLAGNLGVVELTVALETVYDTRVDRLVFDVGHQSYVHKLLTGRREQFPTLRQFGGMSGFPKPSESETDSFVAGHASSSVSIALGMARARTLLKQNYQVVALLGDGAATGGMVYEGLNDAAISREKLVIVLNDNEMSIDRNVGGLSRHLSQLRTKEKYLGAKRRYRDALKKIPGGKSVYLFTKRIKDRIKRIVLPTTIFENMGLTYLGPVDGHDINNLIRVLSSARDLEAPVLVHVMTHKGHGYQPAEESPSRFHGVGKFDPATGRALSAPKETFSDRFGATLSDLATKDPRVCAITAAMPGGTGLLNFKKMHPKRLFDVGIAEEHAVSMAGGLAKQGMRPVVALYSTFLQRSYDQIMQDIALLGLHIVLAVDRAGLVGEDGATHHGVFDIGFLRQMPAMRILCPVSMAELSDMLTWAVEECDGAVAVRYPRGGDRGYVHSDWNGEKSTFKVHRKGNDVTLLTYGVFLENVMQAADLLAREGIEATVIRLLRVDSFRIDEIRAAMGESKILITAEEAAEGSGIREALAYAMCREDPQCRVCGRDLGKQFTPHGSLASLYQHCGLDAESIARYAQEVLSK